MDTINQVKEMLQEIKVLPEEVRSSYKAGYTQALLNVINLIEYDDLKPTNIVFAIYPYIDRNSGNRCEVFKALIENDTIHEVDYGAHTKSMTQYIMDFYDIQYFPINK